MPTGLGLGTTLRYLAGVAGSGGGAPVFNPADLSPLAWYDHNDPALLTVNNDGTGGVPGASQAVGRSLDKSGNGHHLAAPAANNRPTRKTTAGPSGTMGALLWDVTDDYLVSVDSISSVETHYIFVAKASPQALMGRGGAATEYLFNPSGATALVGFNSARGGTQIVMNDATFFTSTWSVYRLSVTPALATRAAIYRDGALIKSDATAVGTSALSATLTLGATNSTGASKAQGLEMGEFIMLGAVDSAGPAQVEAWLKAKWGTP